MLEEVAVETNNPGTSLLDYTKDLNLNEKGKDVSGNDIEDQIMPGPAAGRRNSSAIISLFSAFGSGGAPYLNAQGHHRVLRNNATAGGGQGQEGSGASKVGSSGGSEIESRASAIDRTKNTTNDHFFTPRMKQTLENLNKSKGVEDFLKKEKMAYEQYQKEPKLLILGSSDCGKSTLLKQMKILHQPGGFTASERNEGKACIYAGIVFAVVFLFNSWIDSNTPSKKSNVTETPSEEVTKSFLRKYDPLLNFTDDYQIHDSERSKLLCTYREDIIEFWQEPMIKATYEKFENLLPDTTTYFMTDLPRILQDTFVPIDQDILNVRMPTRQISETIFTIDMQTFHFFDVSGLRQDRAHWLQYFDKVDAVLFVAALSSYDQFLSEDPTVNRMLDSLVLFQSMVNNKLLVDCGCSFILFLNKKDIFKKKIKVKSLKNTFPEYEGKSTADASTFICQKFSQQFPKVRKDPKGTDLPPLTIHLTSCNDVNGMKVVISKVMESYIKKNLDALNIG